MTSITAAGVQPLWSKFFPKDPFFPDDKRLAAIHFFSNFFLNNADILRRTDDSTSSYFNLSELQKRMAFDDFLSTLQSRPKEVIGCIGIALNLELMRRAPSNCPVIILPRFRNLKSEIDFGELKSSSVGQFVAIRGYVVRISPCKPLIEGAAFFCAKCQNEAFIHFEDGIYSPPPQCPMKKYFIQLFVSMQQGVSLTIQ